MNLQESLNLYEDKNVPTYLDFVMGLPKETLDTFKKGITDLMEFGSHNYMAIYVLTALPNTPFRDPEYIDEYGIQLVETKRPFYHNSFMKDQTPETETIVVGTDTMSYEDWKMSYMYRWLFTFGHFLNASSTFNFKGTFFPPRMPSSAGMTISQSASRILSFSDSGEKPPKTTE